MQQPEPETVPFKRFMAMCSALTAQRNATADEVVNLCGDLAELRAENARLKEEIERLKGDPK